MTYYYHIEYNDEHIVDEYNTDTLKEAMIQNHLERTEELKAVMPPAMRDFLLPAADALLEDIKASDPQLIGGVLVTENDGRILPGAVSYWSESKEKAVRLM